MGSPFDAPINPPSFVPQITSLGTLMDTIAKRRMELQQQQDQSEQYQANLDRQVKRDNEREAYGRRKQDLAEKKMDADAAFKRAQGTQASLKDAKAAIAAGRNPGTMLVQGPDGNPVYVDWKYIGGQEPQATQPVPAPAPATPPAQAQSPTPAPTPPAQGAPMPSVGGPAVMNLPFALAQRRLPPPPTPSPQDQHLEELMNQAGSQPQATSTFVPPTEVRGMVMKAAPGPKDPAFLDRNDEGDATALLGADGGDQRQLPIESFPPGAKEGQTFSAEDVNLQGEKGNPFAEPVTPPASPDNSIFLDRNDEGTATALSGPGGIVQQQLPIDAFPPGAKEGQTFSPSDVNMRGGKGNPFAEPISSQYPARQLPPDPQAEATSTFVPPTEVRGMVMQPTSAGGGRWEARLPDGQVITVDPGEARAARRDEVAAELRDIDTALADPSTAINPQVIGYLTVKKRSLLANLSPAEIKQVYGQSAAMEKQGAQIASNEGMQDKRLATQEKLAAENNATRLATSKYGRGGGGKAKTIVQSSGAGSAFSQLKPTEQSRIENAVNNGITMLDREMNWTKLEGIGFDRLNLALQNIRAKGDLGGAQQMEAMMNFFGYIRGGVPAKNETDEFKSTTSNLGTMLDKLGQKVGLGNLWTNFTGSQADKESLAQVVSQLPAAQRASLEQAIVESQKAIQGMALKNVSAQVEAYKSAGVPFHERLQDKINSKLRFIGEQPRQWFRDSPLIPDFDASKTSNGGGGGKLTDQQLLDALKGMK